MVDGDAQQPSRGALDLHEVKTETADGLLYDLLQCHCCVLAPRSAHPLLPKTDRPKKTGGCNPPVLVVKPLL